MKRIPLFNYFTLNTWIGSKYRYTRILRTPLADSWDSNRAEAYEGRGKWSKEPEAGKRFRAFSAMPTLRRLARKAQQEHAASRLLLDGYVGMFGGKPYIHSDKALRPEYLVVYLKRAGARTYHSERPIRVRVTRGRS